MKRKKGYGLERLGEALNELAEHKGRNTVRNRKFFRGTAYTFTRGGWVGHARPSKPERIYLALWR